MRVSERVTWGGFSNSICASLQLFPRFLRFCFILSLLWRFPYTLRPRSTGNDRKLGAHLGLLEFPDDSFDPPFGIAGSANEIILDAGWNFALGSQLGESVFHPTGLTYFRDRLIEHEQSRLVFAEILEGLVEARLVERRGKQREDETQMLGRT